jgi:hypothetical protein
MLLAEESSDCVHFSLHLGLPQRCPLMQFLEMLGEIMLIPVSLPASLTLLKVMN